MFNHSCNPILKMVSTLDIKNDKQTWSFTCTSLRNIKADEELTVSYVSEFALNQDKSSRRKLLLETYGFVCQCIECKK